MKLNKSIWHHITTELATSDTVDIMAPDTVDASITLIVVIEMDFISDICYFFARISSFDADPFVQSLKIDTEEEPIKLLILSAFIFALLDPFLQIGDVHLQMLEIHLMRVPTHKFLNPRPILLQQTPYTFRGGLEERMQSM